MQQRNNNLKDTMTMDERKAIKIQKIYNNVRWTLIVASLLAIFIAIGLQ